MLLTVLAATTLGAFSGQPVIGSLPESMDSVQLQAAAEASFLSLAQTDTGVSGSQRGFGFSISNQGRLSIGALTARTVAYGFGTSKSVAGKPSAAVSKFANRRDQFRLDRPNLQEWYNNEPSGLHHWYQVAEKLGEGPLWIEVGITGETKRGTVGDGLSFETETGCYVYRNLQVWDSRGKLLPAQFVPQGDGFKIQVDDTGARYPVTIDPEWAEEQILTASDWAAGDYFGGSVAIDGDTAVVGAPFAEHPVSGVQNSGVAYVFRRIAGSWNEVAKLLPLEPSADAWFGDSVAIVGNVIAVGAPYEGPARRGAVHIFTEQSGTWFETALLRSSRTERTLDNWFGKRIAMYGNTLVVAAPDPFDSSGFVEVFTRNSLTWSQSGMLGLPAGENRITDVDYDGERIVVGAQRASNGEGRAFVYSRNGDVWQMEATLRSTNPGFGEGFGYSVATSNNVIVVGSQVNGQGLLSIFERNSTGWVCVQTITRGAPGVGEPNGFGHAVDTDGQNIVVTAIGFDRGQLIDSGGVFLYRRTQSGNEDNWHEVFDLTASDPRSSDLLGVSVALDGSTLFTGAQVKEHDSKPSTTWNSGKVYVHSIEPAIRLTIANPQLVGSESSTVTVSLADPAPSGGVVVSLSSSTTAVTVPATVTIPAGATSATFSVQAANVTANASSVITGTAPSFAPGQLAVSVVPRNDAATFMSQSVAASYYAGNTHTVSVTMRNDGNTTWEPTTHRLFSFNPYGNNIWGRTDVRIPTGARVRPGETFTFTFDITAPATTGTYNFQWQMRRLGFANFGQTTENRVIQVLAGNHAEFISAIVPTNVRPGQKFDVQFVFRNRGTTNWTYDQVRLLSKSVPINLFGRDSIPLASTDVIRPGQYKTFTFSVRAPSTDGSYDMKWQMRRVGVANFGPETPTYSIQVRSAFASEFVSQSVPTSMLAANSYNVSVTFRNTGTETWLPGTVILYSQNPAGNTTWRVNSATLPSSVPTGGEVTVNFTVFAPQTPGTYNFQWRLRRLGSGDFGASSPNQSIPVS